MEKYNFPLAGHAVATLQSNKSGILLAKSYKRVTIPDRNAVDRMAFSIGQTLEIQTNTQTIGTMFALDGSHTNFSSFILCPWFSEKNPSLYIALEQMFLMRALIRAAVREMQK